MRKNRESILFEANDEDLSFDDQMEFGVVDIVTKVVGEIIEKVKCSLGALGELFIESDLLDLYMELKQNVEELLENDVNECMESEGLTEAFK